MKQFSKLINEKLTLNNSFMTNERLTLNNSFMTNERLTLNNQSKAIDDIYVLCRLPLFNKKSPIFVKQYKDRKIVIFSKQLNLYLSLFLVTIDEVINFWGLNYIQTSPNKKSKEACILYKLPEQIKNNITKDDIKKYINDNYWKSVNLEKYYIDNENNVNENNVSVYM